MTWQDYEGHTHIKNIPYVFRLQEAGKIDQQIDLLTNGMIEMEETYKRQGFLYKQDGTKASTKGSKIILGQLKSCIRNLNKVSKLLKLKEIR